jgi:cytochrome P450
VKDKGFFPFGYGQRTCIGNQLSQMEAATFMIKLLTKFNFIAHDTYKPKIFAGISLTTSNGIVIRLQRRPSAAAAAAGATTAAASSGNLGGAE